jgi:hypothetical protein
MHNWQPPKAADLHHLNNTSIVSNPYQSANPHGRYSEERTLIEAPLIASGTLGSVAQTLKPMHSKVTPATSSPLADVFA